MRIAMISDDSQAVANLVAEQIEIGEVSAQVLPADKASSVRRFQSGGKNVAMVGDGLNDAQAPATADVGIRLGPVRTWRWKAQGSCSCAATRGMLWAQSNCHAPPIGSWFRIWSALLIYPRRQRMSPKSRSLCLKGPRNYHKMRMMPGSSALKRFGRRSEWSWHESVCCNRMKTVALRNSPVAQR